MTKCGAMSQYLKELWHRPCIRHNSRQQALQESLRQQSISPDFSLHAVAFDRRLQSVAAPLASPLLRQGCGLHRLNGCPVRL